MFRALLLAGVALFVGTASTAQACGHHRGYVAYSGCCAPVCESPCVAYTPCCTPAPVVTYTTPTYDYAPCNTRVNFNPCCYNYCYCCHSYVSYRRCGRWR